MTTKFTAPDGRYTVIRRPSMHTPLPLHVQVISDTDPHPYIAEQYNADGTVQDGLTLTASSKELLIAAVRERGWKVEQLTECAFDE